MPVGKFSLNLSNCPVGERRIGTPPSVTGITTESDPNPILASNEWIDQFYKMISGLVSKSHLFEMSLQNLNSIKMSPSKDYSTMQLKSSPLQLSRGTILVLDETALQQGKLYELGTAK